MLTRLRKSLVVFLALFMLGSPFSTIVEPVALAETAQKSQQSIGEILDESTLSIGPGVTQTKMKLATERGPQQVYKLDVDPSNPAISFEAGLSNGTVMGMQPVVEQAAAVHEEGHRVIGAVNGDFYNTSSGEMIDAMIKNGEILSSRNVQQLSKLALLGFKADGRAMIGKPELSIAMTVNDDESVQVDAINKTRGAEQLVLYTPAFASSTQTNEWGGEVVLSNVQGNVQAGKTVTATVEEVRYLQGDSKLEEGQMILSGHGSARDYLNTLQSGDTISLSFNFDDKNWNEVVTAIGGQPVLVDNGTNIADSSTAIAPRTAVGVKADGSVFFLVIDGRQPGFSEGVTLSEAADMLIEMGAVSGINLDGGGSSTFAARQPGDNAISVVNSPSDGGARAVANSLFVISKAPQGELSQITVLPNTIRLLAGTSYSFNAKGQDDSFNPVDMATPVTWSTTGDIGSIDKEGTFISSNAGEGTVEASASDMTGTAAITVVDEMTDIMLQQTELTVDPGATVQLTATGTLNGQPVIADQNVFDWKTEGEIGTINEKGEFHATDGIAKGKVIVSYGNQTAEMIIEVGKEPIILEDFENGIDHWTTSGARYTSIKMAQTSSPEPVRFGNHSLQLDYDFTETEGTSGAYAYPKEDIEIEGYPKTIGMWVYGDGMGHWLRAQLRDGDNKAFAIDFDTNVSWTGWKYVEADIPAGKPTPIKLDLAVRYMETNNDNKNAGTIYVDNIRATYGETFDDLTNPEISNIMPEMDEKVESNTPEISLQVKDNEGGTGVNPDGITMQLDGQEVSPEYDEITGTIHYKPEKKLSDGIHQVYVKVLDHFGNPGEATWSFQVDTDGPMLALSSDDVPRAGNDYSMNLAGRHLDELKGASIMLTFDPEKAFVVDADDKQDGVQVELADAIKEKNIVKNAVNNDDGTIELELTNLHEISGGLMDAFTGLFKDERDSLATIHFQIASDAEETFEVTQQGGSITLKEEEESLPIFLKNVTEEIEHDLSIEVDGIASGLESKIIVKDTDGNKVKNADINVLSPTNRLATLKADTEVYESEDAASKVTRDVEKGQKLLVQRAQDGWTQVILTDGETGWIKTDLVSVKDWGLPLGKTNKNGEVVTDELTLAVGEYKLQAVQENNYSPVQTVVIKPKLGGEQPEHVVLTWEHDPKTSQSITWRTTPDVTDSVLEIVETDKYDGFPDADVKRVDGSSFQFESDLGVMQMHEVDATNLKPGTSYTYRVGDWSDKGWSEVGTFTTEANEEEAFSFLFTSDTQAIPNGDTTTGYGIWGEIFDKGLADYPDARFMLLSGDIVDYGDQQIHWEKWFEAAKDHLPNVNMVPTLGNHDVVGTGELNFAAQFQLPQNGPEGELENVYSFDYQNLHVAVLNTEGDLEKQAEWLLEDMNNSDKEWKIVSFHRSPYHSHESRGSQDVQDAWPPYFDKAGVDLVLSGHDHAYMRSWPLYNGEQVEEDQGTTYIIGGTAGPKFYQMGNQDWIRVGFDEDTQIYSGITIDGNELSFDVTTRDGRNVDGFKMVKPELPERIYGETRYETAVEISKQSFDKAETVVLSRGDDYPDALAGGPLAYKENAPILLTPTDDLHEATKNEIKRLEAKNVIILGGENAVSTNVKEDLEGMGMNVERLGGETRYETAAAIAERLGGNPEKAIVAYGMNFPDALAVAPYAARNGYPIMLTDTNELPEATEAAVTGIDETIVVGGERVVNESVLNQLPKSKRIAGEDRFETAAMLIEELNLPSERAFLATGMDFADALTGSVLAAKTQSPMLLVKKDSVPKATEEVMKKHTIEEVTILGGPNVVE